MYQSQVFADQIRSTLFNEALGMSGIARGAMPDDSCDPDGCVEFADGWRTWMKAYGLGGQVDGDGNAPGFIYSFAGFMGGLERKFGDSTRVGLTAGYNYTTADFRGVSGNTNSSGLIAGLYGAQNWDQAYLFGTATYGLNSYDSSRVIAFPGVSRIASGSADQNDFNGYLEAGFTECVDIFRIQPLLGLEYLYLNQNGFVEHGAGALNLAENGQSTQALWSMAGARLSLPVDTEYGCFIPHLHAKYVYDAIGENRFVDGSLAGAGGSFLIQGAGMGRDFLVAGGGVVMEHCEWLRVALDYTLQTSGRQTSHAGSGAIEVRW
jgi:uncharacterized protein with beta-barrel porin domain